MSVRKAGLEELIMIVGYYMFVITMPTLQQASGPLHNVSACLDAAFARTHPNADGLSVFFLVSPTGSMITCTYRLCPRRCHLSLLRIYMSLTQLVKHKWNETRRQNLEWLGKFQGFQLLKCRQKQPWLRQVMPSSLSLESNDEATWHMQRKVQFHCHCSKLKSVSQVMDCVGQRRWTSLKHAGLALKLIFQACMARTDAQHVMCRPNVIFITVPETNQYERVRTTKSDAAGLPCMSPLSI